MLTPLQSEVRCLDLFNGTTMDDPPANWTDITFNDSGWGFSANPTKIADGICAPSDKAWTTPHGPAPFGCIPDLPAGLEAIWPTATPRTGRSNSGTPDIAGDQLAVFRWHFTLPSTFTIAALDEYGPKTGTPNNADYAVVMLNGNSLGTIEPTNTQLHNFGVLGGNNVLAWSIGEKVLPSGSGNITNGWGASAWLTFRWTLEVAAVGRSWIEVIGG